MKNISIKLWLYTSPCIDRPMLVFSKTKRRAVTLLNGIGIEKEDAEKHLFKITDAFDQENVCYLPIVSTSTRVITNDDWLQEE